MSSKQNPSQFIRKLNQILENSQFQNIIFWDRTRGVLHVKNVSAFVQIVIPRYYNQGSLKSFVRQLNLYGFRKIVRQKQTLIFRNPDFTKENIQLGKFIKRCVGKKKSLQIQTQSNVKNPLIIQQQQEDNNQKYASKSNTQQNSITTQALYIRPKIQSSCYIQHQIDDNSFLNSFASISFSNIYPVHCSEQSRYMEIDAFQESVSYQQRCLNLFSFE